MIRYDYVFNTAGEIHNTLCKQLCRDGGKLIPLAPHQFQCDSYGPIHRFFCMLWLKLTYVSLFKYQS